MRMLLRARVSTGGGDSMYAFFLWKVNLATSALCTRANAHRILFSCIVMWIRVSPNHYNGS